MPAKPAGAKPAGVAKVDCGSKFFVVSAKGTTELEVCTIKSAKGTKIGTGIMVDNMLRTMAGVKTQEGAEWVGKNAIMKTKEQIVEAPLDL